MSIGPPADTRDDVVMATADPLTPHQTKPVVVLGFDGAPASTRALERAAALVGAAGLVVLVTASPSRPAAGPTAEPVLDSPPPAERDAILERGRRMLRERGAMSKLIATDADPAEALVEAAREAHADMILVGRTGSGYVTRALLGSTAENVLRHAPCDVLVVR
jgi:nucleotide-binding universal stress UspA family protein